MIYNKDIPVLPGVNLTDMFCFYRIKKKDWGNKTIDINTTFPCTHCSRNPGKGDKNHS